MNADTPDRRFDLPEGLPEAPAEESAPICLACGSLDLVTEPELEPDGAPTGLLLVTCATCRREVGTIKPPAPGPEAEPEPDEGSLLPGPAEEPRDFGPAAR